MVGTLSYPILYDETETEFDHNGFGILGDCVSCEVAEEANGMFELSMVYPMDGIHYEYISDRMIIKAKPDPYRSEQLFRVYSISRPMSGIVTVLAEHISYDLSGIPIKPFSADSAPGAMAGLKNNAVVDCPFEFWTDKNTSGRFNVQTPSSIRSRLGGVSGSILDVYGGEYEFDNYTVKLHSSRGTNRGVSVRYGKNLTDIHQEQNCASVATGVYPYWSGTVDDVETVVELPEKIVNAPGTYNFVKIRTIDLSSAFDSQPTEDELRRKAQDYVESNNIGIPNVSMTVSFAQLEQYDEYKHLKLLERVSLFDTVNVEFPALGVSATAKAVKLVYDVLSDRVKSVTLGSVRSNIADKIVNQENKIDSVKTEVKSDIRKAQEAATEWLTNGKGYAYFRKDDLGNIVDILFLDRPDIETAVHVMRVGQSGIGFSHNGVNGLYESAWTIDGKFVADFITTGTMLATIIKGGILQSNDGKTFFLDLDNNTLSAKFKELQISGKTVEEISQNEASTVLGNQTQEDIFNKLTNNGASHGLYMLDGDLYINATYIKSGKIVSEGMAYLPPTYDDCLDMLRSQVFPDKYPPKDFYDINGDGVFDVEDVRLSNRVYLGNAKMSDCAGAVASAVTVTIDPFNAEETVLLSGTNMWGKLISVSLGVSRSKIPHIDGDCTVSGRFSVGEHLVTPSLALTINETPKTLSWKDNGDGTFTLIGQ